MFVSKVYMYSCEQCTLQLAEVHTFIGISWFVHNVSVCTKGPRFPYIFLIIQEVRCLLCCHDDNTPCACALHDASAQRMRIKYFIFATTKYSILTLLLRVYMGPM